MVLYISWYIDPKSKLSKGLIEQVFFSEIIQLINGAYLEILFICDLNIESDESDPNNNTFNNVLRCLLLSVVILMVPL